MVVHQTIKIVKKKVCDSDLQRYHYNCIHCWKGVLFPKTAKYSTFGKSVNIISWPNYSNPCSIGIVIVYNISVTGFELNNFGWWIHNSKGEYMLLYGMCSINFKYKWSQHNTIYHWKYAQTYNPGNSVTLTVIKETQIYFSQFFFILYFESTL